MEQLGKIIQNKDVSLQTKAKITHTLIFPKPMYGCKSRSVKKADGENTASLEIWFWQRALRKMDNAGENRRQLEKQQTK